MDTGVKLLAIRCYARQNALSELGRSKLERQYLGATAETDAQICYGWTVEKRPEGGSMLKMRELDGWVLSVAEWQRNDQRESFETR
jgi:midasin